MSPAIYTTKNLFFTSMSMAALKLLINSNNALFSIMQPKITARPPPSGM